jgi:hypothetical protein
MTTLPFFMAGASVRTDAQGDDIRRGRDAGQVGRRDTQLVRQRVGASLGAIADGDQQALCMKVASHGRAHGAESDKRCLDAHAVVSAR